MAQSTLRRPERPGYVPAYLKYDLKNGTATTDTSRTGKRGVPFTPSNVMRKVKEVRRWWGNGSLTYYLCIPKLKQEEIRRSFPDEMEQKKQSISYLINTDPLAGWRRLISALDKMKKFQLADSIRSNAEPLTDTGLTPHKLLRVFSTVSKFWDIGLMDWLGVPDSVWTKIRECESYSSEDEKRMAVLQYCLQTLPGVSWGRIAGVLWRLEEHTALETIRQYLPEDPRDPSFIPSNLLSAMDELPDAQWNDFGKEVNVPESILHNIERRFHTDGERKAELLRVCVTEHPDPTWERVSDALYKCEMGDVKCQKTLENLQSKFPTGRYRSKQIYEQEMKRGHIELNIDKVVMFGIAGSGKTCTLDIMLGKDPPDVTCSTPLMKKPVEVLFMDVDKKLHWKIKTLQDVNDSIAEIIRSRMPKQQVEATASSTSPASPSQQHTAADQPFQPTSEKTTNTTSESAKEISTSSEKKPTGIVQSKAEESLDSMLPTTDVDEEFVSLINTSSPSSEPILRLRQILVLDSGGQPHFHELIPVFLNGASDFVYVFKVHESLDMRSMIRYFKEGKLVFEFDATQTNEEVLKQCTRAMTSLTAKNKDIPLPRLLFVATHPDKVADEELPGVLETLHKKLNEILLPRFKDQIVYCNKKGEDFIFVMNAAKPVKKDQECAEAIRRCLSKEREGRKTVKIPLRWYALYQMLIQVMESLGKKVLSREQCGSMAKSMEIDDESCEEALQFFNRLNMLFYFPDILSNLVFMEPQILLDKVTELVEESYRMSQAKEDQPLCPMEGEQLKFRDYGQVTEKFLRKFDSHYEEPLFTPKELITLLKGLLVFADLSEDVYFMPCLLQVETPEVVAIHRVSGENALALHFPSSGPLLGMFCSTVAYLLSPHNTYPCPWKVVQDKKGTPKCLNRNVIEFSVDDIPGTVSLIDHFTHFEIHINTIPKKAVQLWKVAHDAVFAGLKKAGKTLGYTNNTPVPAIVCPAHPNTPHPATMDNDHAWRCVNYADAFGEVKEDSLPTWWTYCSPQPPVPVVSTTLEEQSTEHTPGSPQPSASLVSISSNPQPPTATSHQQSTEHTSGTPQPSASTPPLSHPSTEEQTLNIDDFFDVKKEVLDVASKWRDVGEALRLRAGLLETIEFDCKDAKSCLAKVLTEWLNQNYNTTRFGPPSWKLLVAAVDHPAGGNNHALAEQIAQKHNVPTSPPPQS